MGPAGKIDDILNFVCFNFVDLETKGSVAYITLNRPEAMNALNETVVDQIAERFDEGRVSFWKYKNESRF